jgi:hypothetical protein
MDIVSDAVKVLVPAAATFFLGRSLEKYKGRTVYLKKRQNVQHIALAGQSGWGDIQILYNKAPCNSLYVASLELVNESGQNIEGFTVHISIGPGETIYKGSGRFSQGEALKDLTLDENFWKTYNETWAEAGVDNPNRTEVEKVALDNKLNYIFRNVIFNVPFLNKKEKASFSFLIDSVNGTSPKLTISFGRGRLDVVTDEDDDRRKQIRKIWVGVSSTVLFFIPIPYIIKFSPSVAWGVWLTIMASVVAYLLAYVTYYTWALLRKKR